MAKKEPCDNASKMRMFLVVPLLLAGCGARGPAAPDALPTFVDALVRQLSTEPVANPPASITRYEYKGRIVYYVPPRCCDIRGDVYLPDGTLLCQPDGGFAGRGDGRCADFFSERRNQYIVWRDSRTAS